MSTMTLRIADDKPRRLKQLARSRGVSVNQPAEE